MYFRGVNRGVSFTKVGFYTTGFVILLGLFATGSGANGMFLALGFGLSALLVSGLLSEKVMKNYHFLGLSEVIAEADTPFTVPFQVANRSPTWYLIGLETLVVDRLPRFFIFRSNPTYLMQCRLPMLAPGESVTVPGSCVGLPRGVYRKFTVIQRTLFPFGLLSKFKISPFECKISVLPRLHPPLAAALESELRQQLLGTSADEEFHGHRLFTAMDSLRFVDWRKSAGLDSKNWSIKVFRSPSSDFGVLIDADLAALLRTRAPAEYELALSEYRTACEVVRQSGRKLVLQLGKGRYFNGYEEAVQALIGAPIFEKRGALPELLNDHPPDSGTYIPLAIAPGSHRWETGPRQFS